MLDPKRVRKVLAFVVGTVVIATGVSFESRRRTFESVSTPKRDGPPQKQKPLRRLADAEPQGAKWERIDTHLHIGPVAIERAVKLMDKWGIAGAVNLSGMSPGPPNYALDVQLKMAALARGRVKVFVSPNFMRAMRLSPQDYGVYLAQELKTAKEMGAVGVKISKGLGLGYEKNDGSGLLPIDDPLLDPMFEAAGALDMPVAIHSGDPKAFWLPADENNERIDELKAHPSWSFYGEGIPSWQDLFDAYERRVARHPKTTFIGVHFGNAPEEPDRVAAMLDKYPNLYIDTAARVPEIGRHDAEKMRAFFTKYQDRILFATDTGVGESQEEMMYGSNGAEPPTQADEERFFEATYRYFETRDKQFDHPSPIQGKWKIDGLGLPDDVLRKVYYENAAKLLGWRPKLPR